MSAKYGNDLSFLPIHGEMRRTISLAILNSPGADRYSQGFEFVYQRNPSSGLYLALQRPTTSPGTLKGACKRKSITEDKTWNYQSSRLDLGVANVQIEPPRIKDVEYSITLSSLNRYRRVRRGWVRFCPKTSSQHCLLIGRMREDNVCFEVFL